MMEIGYEKYYDFFLAALEVFLVAGKVVWKVLCILYAHCDIDQRFSAA